jgi:hypothetical protein
VASYDERHWAEGLIGILVLAGLIAAGLALAAHSRHHHEPGARPHSTTSPLSNNDYGYWYCWDVGDPHPHHLGVRVTGDHLCTDVELQQATPTP